MTALNPEHDKVGLGSRVDGHRRCVVEGVMRDTSRMLGNGASLRCGVGAMLASW